MKTFAMSNHFNPMEGFDRPQDFHAQARIIREAGLDGYYYNMGRQVTPENLHQCAQACEDEGIELAAAYWVAQIGDDVMQEEVALFRKLLSAIPDNCPVEIGFADSTQVYKPSSQDGIQRVTQFVTDVLPDLRDKNCICSVYPHVAFIVETVAQSLDVMEACGQNRMKAVASAFHCHLADEDWLGAIRKSPHSFQSVSLCGISKPGPVGGYTIEPLGVGSEVNCADAIQALKNMGYNGWIGLQGYGVEGHSRNILGQSAGELRRCLHG